MDNTANFRSRTIAISHHTHWMLHRIAAAKREDCGPLDKPETADYFAERILSEYLAYNYPKLAELYEQRRTLDKQAEQAAKQSKATNENSAQITQ